MNASIFIMPHERAEALEAYARYLNAEQIEQIDDAPETAIINLKINVDTPVCTLTVIEEG